MHSNKVEYGSHAGGDIEIAAAAWTSTQVNVKNKKPEDIRRLIVDKLWNNHTGKPHQTPFERGAVTWIITCDVATHIQLLKHRHANINGESARYRELKEDKYYLPEDWAGIESSTHSFYGEPCSGMTPTTELGAYHYNKWIDILQDHTERANKLYHACLKDLRQNLGNERAKESARLFRTYSSQITLSVQMNMSCFSNFVKLRKTPEAQLEIREIAAKMIDVVNNIEGNPFQYTMEAFRLS